MTAVGDDATANWADSRPRACSGTISFLVSAANTPTSQAITFPVGRFTSPATTPMVVVGGVSGTPGTVLLGVAVTGVSSTGATVVATTSTSSTTVRVNWIAVENA